MRTFTDSEILSRVEQLDTFEGWRPGAYSIWVRSDADLYDRFDDKCFIYWCDTQGERPKFIMKLDGTTNAGSFGLKNFRTYNPLGCAVLKADHMVYGSHEKGFHKHRKDHPAYRQVKPWPYYRDSNGNNRAEMIGKLYYDIIGANFHRASWMTRFIRNWSTACLVAAIRAQFDIFLLFMQGKGWPKLNTAILIEGNIGR